MSGERSGVSWPVRRCSLTPVGFLAAALMAAAAAGSRRVSCHLHSLAPLPNCP